MAKPTEGDGLPVAPEAAVTPTARKEIATAVQQIHRNPDDTQAIAKIAVDLYSAGHEAGLKLGLSLERRPEKKKSWLES